TSVPPGFSELPPEAAGVDAAQAVIDMPTARVAAMTKVERRRAAFIVVLRSSGPDGMGFMEPGGRAPMCAYVVVRRRISSHKVAQRHKWLYAVTNSRSVRDSPYSRAV